MFYPSHPSWESSQLSLLGTLEPFPTACVESLRTLMEHSVTPSQAREMDADGGTSTSEQRPARRLCSIMFEAE